MVSWDMDWFPPATEIYFIVSIVFLSKEWRAKIRMPIGLAQKPGRGEEGGERLSPSFEASWLLTPRARCRAQIISWHWNWHHSWSNPCPDIVAETQFFEYVNQNSERGGPDPQSLNNRVNAGRIERFESFRLRDLKRGSKWLPEGSSSQFGRKLHAWLLSSINILAI